MSVQTQIDRISTAVQNAHLKVIEKGGTSAAPYLVANLAQAIGTIPEASEPTLQSKTVTPTESAQTVRPDSGYDGLSSVAVGAISSTYVGSDVPRIELTVYTPGLEPQLIDPGQYIEGVQYIMGEPNLTHDNIKRGVSIFNTVGTYEGENGGLPDGVSAIACGTVTPTEDSAYLFVPHSLGVVPNFLFWALEDDTSGSVLTSTATMGATIVKDSKYTASSAIIYNVHNLLCGYSASSQQTDVTTRVGNNAYMTATEARMTASTTYYLRAGKTYRWVCGVLDGIQ